MQIMLDSTLGKILAAKQVGTASSNEQKDALMEDKSESKSKAAEAEIRLVVRFIVEEQLVYNGKVERVIQLENEELSRIVSRVAWDGAKDDIESDANDKVEKTKEKEARVLALKEAEEQNFSSQTGTTNDDTSSNPTNSSADNVQEKTPRSNIKSSDHTAPAKKPTFTPQDLHKNEENSVAQVITPHRKSTITTECDIIDSEHSPKNTRDESLQNLEDSPTNQNPAHFPKFNRGIELGDLDIDVNSCFKPFDSHMNSNDAASDDRQSILETLNDCLTSVDLESRNINPVNVTPAQTDELSKLNDVIVEQIEPSELFNDEIVEIPYQVEDKIVGSISENGEPNGSFKSPDINIKPKQDLPAIKEVYCKNNTNKTVVYHGKNYSSPPTIPNHKRKSSLDKNNPSAKRVRRSTHKEYKSVKTRTGEDGKSKDCTSAKQNSASGISTPKVSSLTTNQQVRQKKVFAKWSDNHFYPGTILRIAKDRKFVIGFFDGAQRNVAEIDLIPLCNIEGKQVRVSIAKNYCVNAIVHDQSTPVGDQPMFNVEYQQDGLVRKCVPLKDIFLTGEQGTPLITQPDKNSGISNFADVDLDNIIYEKRSRRLQEMEDFELTKNSSNTGSKSPSGKGYISVMVDF